ncbi:MAG: tRNA lysidine(34) synthetase TilS [Mycoplasmoidaceae bacterium]|nr:MAG: tRNA lysidine(34) synthetase TilS [Mycoplasmoidaceae bacterium]
MKYIIAVSGGPDSMALLNKYKKSIDMVCNVNYNHRSTALRDEKIVRKYCKENKLKLKVLNVTKTIYKKYNIKYKNFQSAARHIRYDFFLTCGKKINNINLLVAHNYDDFLETAIMQLRKNSKALFYGIKQNTFFNGLNIYRPLLNERKIDLQKYCDKQNIPYGIDESNLTDLYERNKIRKEISNMSKKQFESLVKQINAYNKKNNQLLESITSFYNEWKKNDLCVEYIKSIKNIKILYYLIYNFLSENDITRISANKIKGMISFILNNNKHKKYRIDCINSISIKLGKVDLVV